MKERVKTKEEATYKADLAPHHFSSPGELLLQLLHGLMALGVELDLGRHIVVQVPQVVGLDGRQALHEELGDLHLLVILSLGDAEFVLSLKGRSGNNTWSSRSRSCTRCVSVCYDRQSIKYVHA